MKDKKIKDQINDKQLRSESGEAIVDDDNSLSLGYREPLVFENTWLFEKHAHFNRERIPERIVHAKGVGAYGTFTVTNDISLYSCAKLFSKIGKKTPIFARFSTVAGERGAADAERDVRGFAVKFYTEDGNWDMTGNNTPVFFVRDPLKFPDFIHTQKRCPYSNMRSETAKWDFWVKTPESMHQVLILFSDRGIPIGMRHMNGYGSHTFSVYNAKGDRFYVKYHFKTQQGHKYYTDQEAAELIGRDRESAQADLLHAIEQKKYPRWKFCIQVMPEKEADTYHIHPFDLTKVWPHKDYPLIEVGEIELNQNPANYFNEVEQSAFNPAHIVPGLGFSPDRMLQARLWAYGDAHRYRLGVNHMNLKVNRPKCPHANNHRDGLMNDHAIDNKVNYAPNQYNLYNPSHDYRPTHKVKSTEVKHYDFREYDTDYYSQPRALFKLFNKAQVDRLCHNYFNSLKQVESKEIVAAALQHLEKIDPIISKTISSLLKK